MKASHLSDAERRKLRELDVVLDQFLAEEKEIQAKQIQVFLWIALNEGKTQRDMMLALDMASSTASRNVAALSNVHRLGKSGLGIVEFEENPQDRRAKFLKLSEKGRKLLAKLLFRLV